MVCVVLGMILEQEIVGVFEDMSAVGFKAGAVPADGAALLIRSEIFSTSLSTAGAGAAAPPPSTSAGAPFASAHERSSATRVCP